MCVDVSLALGLRIATAQLVNARMLLGLLKFKELNPKSPNNGTVPGGGYTKVQCKCKFVVTDDLNVSPVSSISTLHIIKKSEVHTSNLVEKEVSLREIQVIVTWALAAGVHIH